MIDPALFLQRRQELVAQRDAAAAAIAAARARRDELQAAADRSRPNQQGRVSIIGGGYHLSPEGRARVAAETEEQRRLDDDAREAYTRAAALESTIERSSQQIRDVDRLLNAARDAASARQQVVDLQRACRERSEQIAQLVTIEGDLKAEIAELEIQAAAASTTQARADLQSRLTAGIPTAPSAERDAIEGDLVSRRATLAAAASAKVEQTASHGNLDGQLKEARRRYFEARGRQAELAYYEILSSILPTVAELVACGSRPSTLDLGRLIDDEQIRIARARLDAELEEIKTPADDESFLARDTSKRKPRHERNAEHAESAD